MTTTNPADLANESSKLFTRRRAVAGAAGALIALPAAIAFGAPFRLQDDDHDGNATPSGAAQASPSASPAAATPAGATPAGTSDTEVTIQDFAFDPPEIEVAVGTTVTWTNQDGVAHTATGVDGVFDTGTLLEGESGSHTFDTTGTFRYVCIFHADMEGSVVVV